MAAALTWDMDRRGWVLRYRVNGAVAGDSDFAALFKCPVGAPMRPAPPTEPCSVW